MTKRIRREISQKMLNKLDDNELYQTTLNLRASYAIQVPQGIRWELTARNGHPLEYNRSICRLNGGCYSTHFIRDNRDLHLVILLLSCMNRIVSLFSNMHIANLKQNLNWRSTLNAFQTISYGQNWQLYASVHTIWNIDVPRENRICRLCSMRMVESEFHFLLVCPLHTSIRRESLTSTSWPSVAKFINIMSSNSNRFL